MCNIAIFHFLKTNCYSNLLICNLLERKKEEKHSRREHLRLVGCYQRKSQGDLSFKTIFYNLKLFFGSVQYRRCLYLWHFMSVVFMLIWVKHRTACFYVFIWDCFYQKKIKSSHDYFSPSTWQQSLKCSTPFSALPWNSHTLKPMISAK